jgi:hypothetical protein
MLSDNPELNDLIKRAVAWFDSLAPEEQAAHRREQAQSWVRGELALDGWERKNGRHTTLVAPDAEGATINGCDTKNETAEPGGLDESLETDSTPA